MLKVILETGGNYVKESQLTRQTYQLKWTASRSLALKIKELIFLVSYSIYIASYSIIWYPYSIHIAPHSIHSYWYIFIYRESCEQQLLTVSSESLAGELWKPQQAKMTDNRKVHGQMTVSCQRVRILSVCNSLWEPVGICGCIVLLK